MTENYTSTLQGPDSDRYVKKLQCFCGRVSESNMSTLATIDPYQFPNAEWVDDILLWPRAPGGVSKFVYVFY